VLAQPENTARLVTEAEPLCNALREDTQRSGSALKRLPAQVQLDPTLLPTFEALQGALPAQLEAITALAKSRDWEAVHLRLANEVLPLESQISAMVQNVDREVSEQRAQAVAKIAHWQRRIVLIVPITAVLTLLIAAFLGLAIRRSITQPLGRLLEGSRALARGDFRHRVAISGEDELAHLGRVFNDTAGRLRDLYEALQSREAYLAEAQRLSHTGSFGWKVSSGEVTWSDETFRIFDWDPASFKPSVDSIAQRIHPEDVARVGQEFTRAAKNGTDLDIEHRLLMPEGSVKYVRAVGHPVKDSSGQPEFVGAVMDVTASKQAEEALRQTQATLAHVARVTTLGELTASIAHEVNQPLTAAITNSNTCLRWLARDPPNVKEAREAASRAVKDATRAASTISHIRLLSRKGAPQHEPVDVNEVIRETAVLLRDEAERYAITIRMDLASDLPRVMADWVQLQQVFINLMLNGVEAMKGMNGAGELTIRSRQTDRGQMRISVSDTGVGLARDQANRIFEIFFTTKPDGIGMGLPISRSIVESHGGRLWVETNSGKGTTFHFTLPGEVDARE
jgi:signal transduction histidine kinase